MEVPPRNYCKEGSRERYGCEKILLARKQADHSQVVLGTDLPTTEEQGECVAC